MWGRHGYSTEYHRRFAHLREKPIQLLEIGLLHRFESLRADLAPSLEMWRSYFSHAQLYGFDINDFSGVHLPNCTIVRGDMSDRNDLLRLAQYGHFDIIIDDASHASHHQQIALGCLFPYLRPGGIYAIEDMNWQPKRLEKPDALQTRELLRNFASSGKLNSNYLTGDEADFLESHIAAVEFCNTNDAYNPNDCRDALAFIYSAP